VKYLARKKQKSLSVTTNSNNNINSNINNDISNTDMSPDKFLETYSNTLYSLLRKINNNQGYYPHYSNSLMKDINISPYKPTSQEIEKWLLQPHRYEQQLSNLSQYLEGVSLQFERVVYHFASNLDFYYYIYPITPVPDPKKDKKAFATYKNSKKKALDFLTKLRIQEQFFNITLGVIREGGKFYYLREADNYIDYQEMPSGDNRCIINGRTSLGYTYAFDMTFFLRTPQSLNDYASEFTDWFEDFYEDIKTNQNYFIQMPPKKSVVFLFDDTKAARLNPLRGLFRDVLGIDEYRQLLKTKTMLDTFKLIYLQAPLDKDGKPSIDFNTTAKWVAACQAGLNFGTTVFSSPMSATEIKTSDNQSIAAISSIVGNSMWQNSGISPLTYGSADGKSGSAVKNSNTTDMQFINHMYRQYTKNINYQLAQRTGSYKFGIKMFGDSFSREEVSNRYKNAATLGVCRKEYLASLGKLPEEYEMQMDDETLYSWDTQQFIPFSTSYTQSGSNPSNLGGREKKPDDQLNDGGATTRDYDSNDGKVIS